MYGDKELNTSLSIMYLKLSAVFLNRSFVSTCKRMVFILLKIFKSLNSKHFSSSIHLRIFQYSFLIYVKIEFINKLEIVVAYEVSLCT